MKVLITGCGRIGSHLANILDKEGHEVSIIDKDRSAFKKLSSDFKGKTVGGLGIDQDTLKKAGIESADVFVAVTRGDNTNIMASQIAREIYKVPRVITRIVDPVREEAYRELGLETFPSTTIGAYLIRNSILGEKYNIEKIREMLKED